MKVSKPYNATLLGIIAEHKEIAYIDLKEEYCIPSPPGIVSGGNAMFDYDLATLASEGYIERNDDLIIYVRR